MKLPQFTLTKFLAYKIARNAILIGLAALTFFSSTLLNPNIPTQLVLNLPVEITEPASAATGEKLPWDPGVTLTISRTNHGLYNAYDFQTSFRTGINARASLSGVVVNDPTVMDNNSGGSCGYGNFVKLRYPDGTYAIYAHLASTPLVRLNQQVSQGTVLGEIGQTGCATGIHLHFERRTADNTQANAFLPTFDEPNLTSQNSGQVVTPSPTTIRRIKADFNGDGKTDILRQEKVGDNQYAVSIMYSDGNSFQGGLIPTPDWQVMGQIVGSNAVKLYAGDFNGDGKSDILRQERDSDGNRDVEIYYSNGNGFNIPVPIRWQFESAGGFKGGVNLILQ